MEFKAFKNTIPACSGQWETRLELPIETELLIPDYQPAVFKIIKCLVTPMVLQNRASGGRWQGEGYLRCTVYYQSDEPGSQLYRTEQKFAFEKSVDLPENGAMEGPAILGGELEYCNCRAVSEHRIDLRGAYALRVSLLTVQEVEIIRSLSGKGMEQSAQELTGYTRVGAEEKLLTAQTTLPLPSAGEAILDIDGCFRQELITVQPGQVSCKGSLQMQLCCRPADGGELLVRQKELPVQETLELAGAAEGDVSGCWGEVLSCTLEDAGNGEAGLTVSYKLHAELWRRASYMAVTDGYSTCCQTEVSHSCCTLLDLLPGTDQTVKVLVEDELPDPNVEVLGCFVELGAPQTMANEKTQNCVVGGKGTAHVMASDVRGELVCYDKTFVWQMRGEWNCKAEELYTHLSAAATRISSSKSGDRMRVEIEIGVTGLLLQAKQCTIVDAVEVGPEYARSADSPALYLYYAKQGEEIFSIAKHYHARAKDLIEANGLTAEGGKPQTIEADTCLLIPAAL